MIEKMDMKSMDITEENVKKIQALFPNAVTEVIVDGKTTLKIDFDVLKQELSANLIEDKQERYQMTWPDKSKAKVLANSRITSTLRPDKEKSVDFDNTQNLYIEGDNLDVLKLLRETYLGKVKMIYIDPPYNTGNDFVYNDDFSQSAEDYMETSGQYDEEGNRLVKNLESNGRFHTDWLNMIYPRLKVAKDLLSDDGVIFISIDDNEVDNLRKICDELFSGNNFIAHLIHKNNSMKNQSKYIGVSSEFILVYAKNIEELVRKQPEWRVKKKGAADINNAFKRLKEQGLSLEEIKEEIHELYSRPKYAHMSRWNKVDEFGVYKDADLSRANGPKDYTIINPETGKPCPIPKRGWGKSYEELLRLQKLNLIYYGDGTMAPGLKSYLTEDSESVLDNFIYADSSVDKRFLESLFGGLVFDYPKPLELIKQLLALCTKDDLILDFFSGSATTAHAVMQLNAEDGGKRKFIMVQLPEGCDEKSEAYKAGYKTICEIGEERIRRAGLKIVLDLMPELQGEGSDYHISLMNNILSAKDPFDYVVKNGLLDEVLEEFKGYQDVGFRVLKLDSSNMQDVYYNPMAMRQSLLDETIDNVKTDRTPLDLLFQVMLDLGKDLSAKIEEKQVNGKTYFVVNGNDLIACFDEDIDNSVITEIAKQQPLYAVFKSTSFATDSASINNEQLFKTYSPATEIKVI